MGVTRVNGISFIDFLRRERRVTCEYDPARMIYRVRIDRRGGQHLSVEITALELQSTRLPVYDYVAGRFPARTQAERLDRSAIRLLGAAAMSRVRLDDPHADRDVETRGESRTPERSHHPGRFWTPGAPRSDHRVVETPPSDAPIALAPPGSHVPMYRPR